MTAPEHNSNRWMTFNGVSYAFPASDGSSGQVLSTNGSATLSWTAVSGGGGSSLNVNQAAHGFAVKDAIYRTASSWAIADSSDSAKLAIGVVTSVADADNFTVTFSGPVTLTSHGLTAGQYYYTDESGTTSNLTATEPSTYSNPILFAVDVNTVIILPFRPSQVATVSDTVDMFPNADHSANGAQSSDINAGTTITQFDLVYVGAGGTWLRADATDNTAGADKMLAIAMEAGTATNPLLVALKGSYIRDDTWAWTIGGQIYMSTTTGGLTQTKPSATDEVVRPVGYAISADVIYFDPSPDYITVT